MGDRSSEFYPDVNEVRREGSYIYEEFVETQGTDVKVGGYIIFERVRVCIYIIYTCTHIYIFIYIYAHT